MFARSEVNRFTDNFLWQGFVVQGQIFVGGLGKKKNR